MARKFTLQIIMDLATKIGANPAKAISRSNVSFLGKGPTKNPLFQNRLAGLENASAENLGDPKKLFGAIDDAVGWMKDGKLNSIQSEILGHNLSGIEKIINPPPLPMASVTPIAPGIEGLRRFPRETHKFFGRPLKGKDFAEIDELVAKGRIPPSRLPEPGPGEVASFQAALTAKTGMSRAIARQILLQDPRLNLTSRALSNLKLSKDLGKEKIGSDPLDLMKLLYKPSSMHNYDEFLNAANIRPGMSAKDIATRILAEVELSPNIRYAQGGLARILEV